MFIPYNFEAFLLPSITQWYMLAQKLSTSHLHHVRHQILSTESFEFCIGASHKNRFDTRTKHHRVQFSAPCMLLLPPPTSPSSTNTYEILM